MIKLWSNNVRENCLIVQQSGTNRELYSYRNQTHLFYFHELLTEENESILKSISECFDRKLGNSDFKGNRGNIRNNEDIHYWNGCDEFWVCALNKNYQNSYFI